MEKKEAFYITGITGFLGNHILKVLLKKQNCEIFAFVMPNDKNANFLKKYSNVHIFYGNLLNYDDVNVFASLPFNGDKFFIHCAGKITTLKSGDESVMEINYKGSKNVVDSIKNNDFKKTIYISSVDSLSLITNQVIYEQEIYNENEVIGIYGKSKCLANNYFLKNLKNCVLILPSALFGPDDSLNCPINNAIKKIVSNKLPAATKGGYDLVDVRDCANAIINACYHGKNQSSYILSGHNITIKNLIKKCSEISNCKEVKFTVPYFVIKIADPFIRLHAKIHHKTPLFTGFSMYCLKQNPIYSHEKASKDLSFTPKCIEESLKDTINYLNINNVT